MDAAPFGVYGGERLDILEPPSLLIPLEQRDRLVVVADPGHSLNPLSELSQRFRFSVAIPTGQSDQK